MKPRAAVATLAGIAAVVASVAACSSSDDEGPRPASLPQGGPPASVLGAESGPTREQGELIARLERESTSRVLVAFHPELRSVSSLYLELPSALAGNTAADASRAFLERHRGLFADAAVGELGDATSETQDGWADVRFVRRHRGVRVVDDEVSVGFDPNGALRLVGGRLSPSIMDLDVTPALDRAAALGAARARVSSERLGIVLESEQPIVELVIVPAPGGTAANLVWNVRLPLDPEVSPSAFAEVRVDAKTGGALGLDTGVRSAGATVVRANDLNGWGHDLQVVDSSSLLFTTFLASDTTRKHRTTSCGDIRCTTFATDDRNRWDPGVVSAHHNFAIAYDTFANIFGQTGGPGGRGGIIVSEYDYNGELPFSSSNEGNAYWTAGFVSGGYIRYGRADAGMAKSYAAAVDVVGHEYTHGVIDYTSRLVYAGDSGALNESLADVFGLYSKRAACMNGWNPTCGQQFALGDFAGANGRPLRILSDPAHNRAPAAYRNRRYPSPCSPSNDNDRCGVHSNSAIPNLAFYLLNSGGVNAATGKGLPSGIGWYPATEIWYRAALAPSAALRTLKTTTPSMNDFAIATIAASDALHGRGAQISHRVHCAWNAVDVSPYTGDACSLCTSGAPQTRSLRIRNAGDATPMAPPRRSRTCDLVRQGGAPDAAAPLREGHTSCGSAGGNEGAKWLRVDARPNERVTLHLDGMTQDLDLELFDASGKLLASSMYSGVRTETVSALVGEAATLFARVSAAPGSTMSAFDVVEDNPTGPNADDAADAASCPTHPTSVEDCSGGEACGSGQVCSFTGEGSCCRNEFAVEHVCYCDDDCGEGEVCTLARNEAADGALFTCRKRGRDACLN